MPSYKSGTLIKLIRERKKWQQSNLIYDSNITENTISRIENGHQNPKDTTFNFFMDRLQMPVGQFFYPYLDNQPMDVHIRRDKLIDCLDYIEINHTNYEIAEELINELENQKGFDSGINRQFINSCKARLYECMGKDTTIVLDLIKEGLAISFPEFDEENFNDVIFIFEEIELLHTWGLSSARMGNISQAIEILNTIQSGLVKLPEDDYEKEKKLPKILLTLSHLLIKDLQFQKAIEICELGYDLSIKCKKGRSLPAFLYNKAFCLFKQGHTNECNNLLHQAYFGYSIFHMKEQSELIRINAEKIFRIKINTYGAENITDTQMPVFRQINRGEPITCKSIGDMIAALRNNAGMGLKELSQGICSISNLNKIEGNKIQGNVYHLEAIFQRLGRDINLYTNTFLSATNFAEKQIRNGILSHLAELRYEKAEELLEILKKSESYQSGINRQFIVCTEAGIFFNKEGYSKRYLNKLMGGIRITRPNFSEQEIERYLLTYYEILLINQIAAFYCETNEMQRGVKIFERLKGSINNSYVDETEKIRTYSMILYNYSKYLGLMERYKEAIEMIAEGEDLDRRHNRLRYLNGFMINKACDYLELGKKEESIPYFVQSYYANMILGETDDQEKIAEYVKEKLGIVIG